MNKVLVWWIQYDNLSQKVSSILKIEFLLCFFNSGVILLISNANFYQATDDHYSFMEYFDGQYSDFSA